MRFIMRRLEWYSSVVGKVCLRIPLSYNPEGGRADRVSPDPDQCRPFECIGLTRGPHVARSHTHDSAARLPG